MVGEVGDRTRPVYHLTSYASPAQNTPPSTAGIWTRRYRLVVFIVGEVWLATYYLVVYEKTRPKLIGTGSSGILRKIALKVYHNQVNTLNATYYFSHTVIISPL